MDISGLLLELYGRIPPLARSAVEGLDTDRLIESPAPGVNSIGWQVWHVARVQDQHVAAILDVDQVWATGDWAGHFGLDPDPSNTGWGHSPEDVLTVQPNGPEVLIEYLGAVQAPTSVWFETLTAADLDRVVDEGWDPPVTVGVRLVSIADDCLQDLGQAAYLQGLMGI